MTIPEIIKELEPYTGRFPLKAMKAAVEQQEAITPELLRAVEAVAEAPEQFAKRKDYMLHLFAIYLLAQFREKRAYRPIIKMFSAPGETSYDLAGDTITEGLHRILASVYDGDPAPLQGLIENKEADEYVRCAGIETLIGLERSGQMKRDEVISYFTSLFQGKLEPEPSYAWDALVNAVADFPAPELLEHLRKAYADGLADPHVASLEELEQELHSPGPSSFEEYDLITDAIDEMKWWAAFHPKDAQPPVDQVFGLEKSPEPSSEAPYLPSEPYLPPQPFIREPKIGRNDPCPCGSGKKYKKCCGK